MPSGRSVSLLTQMGTDTSRGVNDDPMAMLEQLVTDPDVVEVELFLTESGFLCHAKTVRGLFQSAAAPTLDAAIRAVYRGRQEAST